MWRLCANKAAGVSPRPLQDDQEGEQVEEQCDSLQVERRRDEEEDGGEMRWIIS